MNEIWKEVIGFDGFYEVSDCGRVRSFYNKQWELRKEPRLLKPSKNAGGYLVYNLKKDKKQKSVLAHRIEVEAFIGRKLEPTEHIDHLNTIRTDNRLSNLRICSQAENNRNPLSMKKHKAHLSNPDNRKKLGIQNKKQLTLRGVKDCSVYKFNSCYDASFVMGLKNKSSISARISEARRKGSNIIRLNGEEFYYCTE